VIEFDEHGRRTFATRSSFCRPRTNRAPAKAARKRATRTTKAKAKPAKES
jgi:hypothetical protein